MKLTFRLFISFIIILVLHVGAYAQTAQSISGQPPNGHNSPYRIAFRDINSDPQYYNGEHLKIVGYLNLQFECDALWPNRKYFINKNIVDTLTKSIAIDFRYSKQRRLERFNHHYVTIEAVFYVRERGLGYHYNELQVTSIKLCNEQLADK